MLKLFFFVSWLVWMVNCEKPNIIFLMADSMDGRNLDPTSSQYPLMNMPALRSIAKQGVNFIGQYTDSPQCVPGRAAFWSGRKTSTQKAFNNCLGWGAWTNGTLDKNCVNNYDSDECTKMASYQHNNYTIVEAMTSLGYDMYLYGKVDVGGGVLETNPQATADGYHMGTLLVITSRSANIFKATKDNPTSSSMLNDTEPHQHSEDHKKAIQCEELLNKLGQDKQTNSNSKPFFLYCSMNIPHPPFFSNETWLQQVDVARVGVPTWPNENDFHPADEYESESKNVWGSFTDEQIIQIRSTYYAMNAELDYILQGVINSAYNNGFNLSNTVFVFTSDHGEMNMEHRQVWKNSMYEASSRVPLIIAGPNIVQNKLVTNYTSLIDILPTLMVLGGYNSSELPAQLEGYSLTPFLFSKAYHKNNIDKYINLKQHSDYISSQYHSNMGNTGIYMVRKDHWKYITYGHYLTQLFPKDEYIPQLFDLSNDLEELNDVSSFYPDIVNEMDNILMSEYNYEYIDCYAKRNDFSMFEKYFWNKYNSTQLYNQFSQSYDGFDEDDWNKVITWRELMLNGTDCDTYAKQFV